MTPTWTSDSTPPPMRAPQGLRDWLRVVRRGVPIVLLLAVGLGLLMAVRLVEWPIFGQRRPLSPHVTVRVCRGVLWLMGLGHEVRGRPMRDRGAFVANHASWLDIFALNAARDLYFVSKAEVAKWPGIGVLARATGTVFISRDRRQALEQTRLFRARLLAGHHLLFFPEGTSTDGLRVLGFKPTLFAAYFDDALRHEMHIQPVSVAYHAPEGADPRYYGWWGDMEFGPHLLAMLATPRHGRVEVRFHPALRVDDFPNRKSLAKAVEEVVRGAHSAALPGVAE